MTEPRLGVFTPVQDWPAREAEEIVASLDEWTRLSRGRPQVVPILHRLGKTSYHRTVACLETIPGAVLYLTTQDNPDEILSGACDQELEILSFHSNKNAIPKDTIVRINQEPGWEAAPWGKWDPKTYVAVFDYIAEKIGGRAWFCPIVTRQSPDDWVPFIPTKASVVGFDAYFKNASTRIHKRLQRYVDWWHETRPGLPVAIGELGIDAEEPWRERFLWLRSLRRLTRVDLVIVMDLKMGDHDVTLTPRMRRWLGKRMRR